MRSLQVLISGGDHPHLGSYVSASSDALKFAFLKDPQESDLSFGRRFPNLIEKDCCLFRRVQSVLNGAVLPL